MNLVCHLWFVESKHFFQIPGRSYCITSHRMLMQCIDSLVQKVQSGVVINFEKIGPDPPSIDGAPNRDGEDDHDDKDMETDNERNGVGFIRPISKSHFSIKISC